MNIALTDAGNEAAGQLQHCGQVDELLDCLTEDEQLKLAGILDKLEVELHVLLADEYDGSRGRSLGSGFDTMRGEFDRRESCNGHVPSMEELPDIVWYEDYLTDESSSQ